MRIVDERLKNIFLNIFFFWVWVRVYICGGYTHLVDFIDRLGLWQGK